MATLLALSHQGYGLLCPGPVTPNLSQGQALWGVVACASVGASASPTLAGPVPVSHEALEGLAWQGYYGATLYGHIHIFPSRIDLGNLLDAQTRQVEVWNACATSQLLAEIASENPDGVELAGDLPPVTFGPLASRTYSVAIGMAGSAVLDARFTFAFPLEQLILEITAQRVIAMPFSPDWSQPPEELLVWKTDVLRAYDGTEQRLRLAGLPRRCLSFHYLFEDANQGARFQSQVWGWQHRVFALPVWQDQQWLASNVAVGAVSIPASTALLDMEAGQTVLLWNGPTDWEIAEVVTFTASAITIKNPLRKAWARGARLIPLRLARLPDRLSWERHSAVNAGLRIDWRLETPGIASNRMLASGLTQYQGYDVLLEEPDWSLDLGEDAIRDIETLDFETGPAAFDTRTGAPEFSRPFNWVIKGRDAIAQLLYFLDAHAGRLKPFWLPTYQRDIEVLADLGAADTTVQIADIQYSTFLAQHANRRDLVFYPVPSTTVTEPFLRRITASAQGAGCEYLTLDSSFGAIRKATSWRCISFLAFVRLDQDSVQLVWETDDLVRLSFRVKEVLL